ncbi:DNA-binding GntR family transcriptional regulator [Melghirimyces profundicolus]|uniref:DNA-binding GntR family transcriptional regulator n=1 Tax=Melghirimyces profundicolus TaxID=1242148 RepID=A0A2T6C8M2_9BACL|nr:DNA-binding GntR family transcriptional regulator [Melghirimyces profundicolus]
MESMGFVITLPRKGVVVADYSRNEIEEIFTILSALEGLAARLAAQKMDEETAKAFDTTIRKMMDLLENGREEEFPRLHLEIHEQLYKASKSPRLYELLIGLTDYIRAFAKVGHDIPGRWEKAVEEHRKIMETVRNGDAELAEAMTKVHVENSMKAYKSAAAKANSG